MYVFTCIYIEPKNLFEAQEQDIVGCLIFRKLNDSTQLMCQL